MKKSDDEGFIRRWARRKDEAREPKHETPTAGPAPAGPQPAAAVAPNLPGTAQRSGDASGRKDEKPFDLSQLPTIDSLTKESDYTLFMRPEVPDDLRLRALRRLWVLDPILSAPDTLDIHAFDYNSVPTFPEGLKSTLYRVGRGLIGADEKAAEDKAAEDKAIAEASADRATAEPSSKPGSHLPESTSPEDDARKAGSEKNPTNSNDSTAGS
jgi:hypothetical protein